MQCGIQLFVRVMVGLRRKTFTHRSGHPLKPSVGMSNAERAGEGRRKMSEWKMMGTQTRAKKTAEKRKRPHR
jgi:hypothetical protein